MRVASVIISVVNLNLIFLLTEPIAIDLAPVFRTVFTISGFIIFPYVLTATYIPIVRSRIVASIGFCKIIANGTSVFCSCSCCMVGWQLNCKGLNNSRACSSISWIDNLNNSSIVTWCIDSRHYTALPTHSDIIWFSDNCISIFKLNIVFWIVTI